jgi:thioesterase domain-containing protein
MSMMLSSEPPRIKDSSALVALRSGEPRNFFLVHDGYGDTLLYLNLAHRMPDDVGVYGIEACPSAGVALPYTRIEHMAAAYVAEVRKKQSHGPYLLGGLCAGGVIAYEMASQLLRSGESIELVVLLDAATPQARKRPARITKERLGRLTEIQREAYEGEHSPIGLVCSMVCALYRRLLNTAAWELKRQREQWWAASRFYLMHQLLTRQRPWPNSIPALGVLEICENAGFHYKAKPLAASIVLIRANRRTPIVGDTPYRAIYADQTLGWGEICQDLIVIDVDGGHSTMLQEPFVGSLSEALIKAHFGQIAAT